MESMGKKPRRRRSFTAEFKAEIVELCLRGDLSVGQVARDFDLTETATRSRVIELTCGQRKPAQNPGVRGQSCHFRG
jgi:transposase